MELATSRSAPLVASKHYSFQILGQQDLTIHQKSVFVIISALLRKNEEKEAIRERRD